MHIPDGYLGPITSLTFYLIMIPIWYLSLKKARRVLEDREVPLLALLSAFSFLIMMFNWPVPDGTTTHMIGGGLVTILLGPYSGVIAITATLLIQALIFGDGGITTLGANAFNMAFIYPFTTYLIIKLIGRIVKLGERRLLTASFIATYIGLDISALLCGLEIGIQPILEPGYCPYPYWVSIPAMLISHLLVAGWIEGLVTMGILSYISSSSPHLLKLPKLEPRL
jgi:cobalt/nickel transport system permease protein